MYRQVGVPNLHVNRPLMLHDVLSHSIKPKYSQSESKKLIAAYSAVCTGCISRKNLGDPFCLHRKSQNFIDRSNFENNT